MHLYDSFPKPIIFGHRGASRYAPENTIAAFDLAIKQGAHAFELDTMLSKDGIPVVIHDHTLERTTTGSGEVNQRSAGEIRELDAGILFSPDFKGEKVPLLEEVLNRYKDEILINIELKNYHAPNDDLARVVLEMVEAHGMPDRVIFSSFLPKNLKILRAIKPGAKAGLLAPPGKLGVLFRSFLFRHRSPEFIHPYYEDISRNYIEKEHKTGRSVNTWTVNDPLAAKNLIEWGVDGLITDDLKEILKLLGQ